MPSHLSNHVTLWLLLHPVRKHALLSTMCVALHFMQCSTAGKMLQVSLLLRPVLVLVGASTKVMRDRIADEYARRLHVVSSGRLIRVTVHKLVTVELVSKADGDALQRYQITLHALHQLGNAFDSGVPRPVVHSNYKISLLGRVSLCMRF